MKNLEKIRYFTYFLIPDLSACHWTVQPKAFHGEDLRRAYKKNGRTEGGGRGWWEPEKIACQESYQES